MIQLRAHAAGSALSVALDPLGSAGRGVANASSRGAGSSKPHKAARVMIKACFTPRDSP
jgi:hypothetical protein